MGFFQLFKQGQHYLKTWPLVAQLNLIFPENRIIKTTLFAQKIMPFLAVFAVVWQQVYARNDISALAIAILTALFALMLPLQGLYWLGKRAKTPLSAQSAVVFQQICQRLRQANQELLYIEQPTYQDLAEVLKKAQAKLPSDFWREL